MTIGRLLSAGLCGFCLVLVGCGGASDDSGDVSVKPTTDQAETTADHTDAVVAGDPAAAEVAASEQAAPVGEVELTEASWEEVQAQVAENKGKVVVLDAWSTSCGPCMKEFPNLVALNNKYQGGDVVCLSMSVDYDGIANKPPQYYRERILQFLTKMNSTLENFQLNQESSEWYEAVDLAALPAVFVYGRDGELVKRFDNDSITKSDEAFTYEQVNQLVEELLAQ